MPKRKTRTYPYGRFRIDLELRKMTALREDLGGGARYAVLESFFDDLKTDAEIAGITGVSLAMVKKIIRTAREFGCLEALDSGKSGLKRTYHRLDLEAVSESLDLETLCQLDSAPIWDNIIRSMKYPERDDFRKDVDSELCDYQYDPGTWSDMACGLGAAMAFAILHCGDEAIGFDDMNQVMKSHKVERFIERLEIPDWVFTSDGVTSVLCALINKDTKVLVFERDLNAVNEIQLARSGLIWCKGEKFKVFSSKTKFRRFLAGLSQRTIPEGFSVMTDGVFSLPGDMHERWKGFEISRPNSLGNFVELVRIVRGFQQAA